MSSRSVSGRLTLKIVLFPPFSGGGSKEEMTIAVEEGSKIRDVIMRMAGNDEHFKTLIGEEATQETLRSRALIIHNDHVAGLEEKVKDGDQVKFLHPIQGG